MMNITEKIIEEMGKYTHHYQEDIVADLEKMADRKAVTYFLMLRECGTYVFTFNELCESAVAHGIWKHYEKDENIHTYMVMIPENWNGEKESFSIPKYGTRELGIFSLPILYGEIKEVNYQDSLYYFDVSIKEIEKTINDIVVEHGGFREKDILERMQYFTLIEENTEHHVVGVYAKSDEDGHRDGFNVDLVTGKLC